MDQGLSDLVQNSLFGSAGTKDRTAKKRDTIGETDSLKRALYLPRDTLIQTKEQVFFPKPQFL